MHRVGAGLGDAWRAATRRLYISPSRERQVIAAFERTYVASDTDFRWLGEKMATPPVDLWIYQEILHEMAPGLIIATTENARYLAAICQLTGTGHVLWIGGEPRPREGVPVRLRRLAEPPLSAAAVTEAQDLAAGEASVLVVLGSNPDGDAVLEQLRRYGPLVTAGSYMIIEDTHLVGPATAGRAAAVEAFLHDDPSFAVDRSREKFYLSANQHGYLRRVGPLPPSSAPSPRVRLRHRSRTTADRRQRDDAAK